jgi:hypothetical protein
MPARKRPAPEDTATARGVLLDGLARDADTFELVSSIAPLHPRDNTFPGEVFLHLAADALNEVAWCQTDDLWLYPLFAAAACIRAAASRASVPARQDLARRPGHPAP